MPENSRLRIIFAGTPTFAADHLHALINSKHDIVAVYSQPDRPAGRGKKLTASPVKVLAEQHNLPVLQPNSLKTEDAQQALAALDADLMIVVAYGLILPQKVLDTPRLGCINVHGSLLPRWRGAAPVQRAIESGDGETGITIMQMDAGLDTGPMLAKATCEINQHDTSVTIFDKLTSIGTNLLIETINHLETCEPIPQDNSFATYAEKITKQEAMVDWQESAAVVNRKIRAFNPFPVAFTDLDTNLDGERVKIYRASVVPNNFGFKKTDTAGTIVYITDQGIIVSCGEPCEDFLRLEEIQLPGKKAMSTKAILLGNKERFKIGDKFTSALTAASHS